MTVADVIIVLVEDTVTVRAEEKVIPGGESTFILVLTGKEKPVSEVFEVSLAIPLVGGSDETV